MTSQDWFNKDFYAILGVPKDASEADIKKAYRKAAKDNHPDRHPGDAAAEKRFKEMGEAYAVLERRRTAQAVRRRARHGRRRPLPGGRPRRRGLRGRLRRRVQRRRDEGSRLRGHPGRALWRLQSRPPEGRRRRRGHRGELPAGRRGRHRHAQHGRREGLDPAPRGRGGRPEDQAARQGPRRRARRARQAT